MEAKLKQSYIQEVKYQTRMLNNLKRWLRNVIFFSSLSLVLILFGPSIHPLIRPIAIVMIIISIISSVLIGLAFKNGQNNINKIIDYMKKS